MPRVYRHRLFIAVSPSTAEALAGIGVDPERIRIVPNGVALDAPDVPKSIDPLFVALGRLVPHKRIDVLLETWERVRPRTGGRLVIIGDGPERAKLEAMAGADVTFTGHLDEDAKQRLLAAAWMLVHPSMLEGWGLVVTEAAAAGTPTLAFDAPGVRDSVAHGESGILARNTEDFVERWVAITGNWRWRTELSLGARRRAAQFSWDNTVDRFLSVAYEAVGRPVPVPAAAPPAVEPVPLSTVIERSGG
jgi:glycosyltransferase involved in cell wall biosynthesis